MLESNIELLRNFENSLKLFKKSSKLSRLVHHPWRELHLKMLTLSHNISEAKATTFYGETLKIVLPETVSSVIYRFGFFEEGLTLALLKLLKPGDTFVDVGAHVGYYSLLASKLVGESGQVTSFEPTPRTRQVLEENTQSHPNVKVEPLAAWSNSDTSLTINDFGWVFSAYNSVFQPRLQQHVVSEKIPVKCTTLDDYFAKHQMTPTVVKIDAESAELEILKGMVQTLSHGHTIVSVEVGDFDLPGVPKSREVVEFAIKNGYIPFEYKAGKFVTHQLREHYNYTNILFVPTQLQERFSKLFDQ
jgi:FkbM family methyltransferase